MSMASGTPSRLMPSSSAVRPHRSSDSVNTSFARLKPLSSRASCSTTSVMRRLIASASSPGIVEKAAVRLTSAIVPGFQDVGVRLRGIRADGKADRLTHLVLRRSRCPGARQVARRSAGVAGREIGDELAEERDLRIERALRVLPARDDLLLERHGNLLVAGGRGRAERIESRFQTLRRDAHADRPCEVERRVRLRLLDDRVAALPERVQIPFADAIIDLERGAFVMQPWRIDRL